MRVWLGDGLIDPQDALVSAFDHGLTTGDGVFEALKVVEGVPFALRRHLDRLEASAAAMGLPPPDRALVGRACRETAADFADGLATGDRTAGRLRVTYTAGPGPLGSDRAAGPPTLFAAVTPVGARPASVSVAMAPWTRNEHGAMTGVKTTSYGENVRALGQAHALGAAEALFLNTAGLLCEGTGSNVFVVRNGRLLTPRLESGCLAGITRELVLEWSDALEADLRWSDLEVADEVFITSTTRDVQPVHEVVGPAGASQVRWPEAPGPVTRAAAQTFRRRAATDVDP